MTSLLRTHTMGGLATLAGMASCLALLGCDDKEPKHSNVSVASGGSTVSSTGSGGSGNGVGGATAGTPQAGANAIGNAGAGAGGGEAASGGNSTTTTTDTAGTSGGGATQTVTSCSSDIECKPFKQLCDLTLKRCVQCVQSIDCTDGTACVAGTCGGTPGCKTNADCAASTEGKACDVTRGRCVQCVAAADCPDPSTSECVRQACVTVATCQNSLQCTDASAPICNRSATPGRCVQCVGDADCVASGAGKVCSANLCRSGCSTNSDCASGMKCNNSEVPNFCAACATHSDCSATQFCSKGSCVADICAAGVDQACIGNGVATCTSDGDGFGSAQACPSGQSCSVTQSRASCSGESTTVTPTVCATSPGTVNPCTKIPAFTGTQVVDAKGDDFCSVPAFELTFKNAAGVNNNKASGGSTSAYTQRAVAQVAWTADAFHAYVEVYGTPVRANTTVDKPWDGDAIELMITTNNTVTGLTSNDASAMHIIANYGVAVTVKSDGSSGTHSPLGAGQFKGTLTTTGYAVELQVPWPNGATPTSGSQIRFDMAMNVDTASVDPTIQGRDAQAVLAMTALSGATSCASTPPTPFCDDRIWCPTALE